MSDQGTMALIVWHIIFGIVTVGGVMLLISGLKKIKKHLHSFDQQNYIPQNTQTENKQPAGYFQVVIGILMIIGGIIFSIVPYFVASIA